MLSAFNDSNVVMKCVWEFTGKIRVCWAGGATASCAVMFGSSSTLCLWHETKPLTSAFLTGVNEGLCDVVIVLFRGNALSASCERSANRGAVLYMGNPGISSETEYHFLSLRIFNDSSLSKINAGNIVVSGEYIPLCQYFSLKCVLLHKK
jgi:hypothetical protein